MRNVCTRFGILYPSQSPDIGKNPDRAISNFQISGQSLIKRNCHNSWTNDDINMKIKPVTKLDKATSKRFNDDVVSGSCDVISIFPVYGQFAAIWKPGWG